MGKNRQWASKKGGSWGTRSAAAPAQSGGVGWLTEAQVDASLERLCGCWEDTLGSGYDCSWDSDGSLAVTTTRPSGEVLRTACLIRVDWRQGMGRIVWGKLGARVLYSLALLEDKQLRWSSGGSKPYTWHRTAWPEPEEDEEEEEEVESSEDEPVPPPKSRGQASQAYKDSLKERRAELRREARQQRKRDYQIKIEVNDAKVNDSKSSHMRGMNRKEPERVWAEVKRPQGEELKQAQAPASSEPSASTSEPDRECDATPALSSDAEPAAAAEDALESPEEAPFAPPGLSLPSDEQVIVLCDDSADAEAHKSLDEVVDLASAETGPAAAQELADRSSSRESESNPWSTPEGSGDVKSDGSTCDTRPEEPSRSGPRLDSEDAGERLLALFCKEGSCVDAPALPADFQLPDDEMLPFLMPQWIPSRSGANPRAAWTWGYGQSQQQMIASPPLAWGYDVAEWVSLPAGSLAAPSSAIITYQEPAACCHEGFMAYRGYDRSSPCGCAAHPGYRGNFVPRPWDGRGQARRWR